MKGILQRKGEEEKEGRRRRKGGEEGEQEPLKYCIVPEAALLPFLYLFSSYLAMELLTSLLSSCTHLKSSHVHTSSLPSVSRTLAR